MKSLPFVLALTALLFLALHVSPSHASVMGIDFGSEFLKIGTITKNGIEIVLNEQTRRKSNNYVGFRALERFVGEDAKNFAPRFPNNMITMLNRLVGVPYDDVTRDWYTKEMMLTYFLVKNENRSTIDVRLGNNPNTTYDVETLMAMIFSYIKAITKDHNNNIVVQDAVFIVPHFYTMQQRTAIVTAGKLGGVNVIGMIHTTTAIALHYAVQNRGFNKTINVAFYDMGSSRLEVGIYTISPAEPGAKKADSMGTITTRSIVSDPFLGARTFDACIANRFANEFFVKSKIKVVGVDTEQARKATTVLLRTANKVREILSANKASPASVEGIAEDKDFQTTLTREEFEAECAPLFTRAVAVAKDAMEKSGMTVADLHAFEVHGGGVRMPKLNAELNAFLGRQVDRTMNGDEAASLGATFYAARLSGTISVKGFAIVDPAPDNVTFVFSQNPDATTAPAKRALFLQSVFPSKKSVSVNRTTDFTVTFGVGEKQFATLYLKDVEKALSGVGHSKADRSPNNTHSVRVEVRLTECGILNVTEVALKYHEYVNVSKKVKTLVNVTETNETVPVNETDDVNANNATSKPAPEYVYTTEYKIELKKHLVPIKYEMVYDSPLPLSKETFKAASLELYAQEVAEEEKRATASAKNDLESLIIGVHTDALDGLKEGGFMNETEEELVRAQVAVCKEWLEDGDGSLDATTKLDFLNQTSLIREAMSSSTEKQRAHFQAIEDEKRAKIKKQMEEEAAAKKAAKKASAKPKKNETETTNETVANTTEDTTATDNTTNTTGEEGSEEAPPPPSPEEEQAKATEEEAPKNDL